MSVRMKTCFLLIGLGIGYSLSSCVSHSPAPATKSMATSAVRG